MPVTDEHALRQFEIEALRQITDNLKRLNDKSEDQGRVLHSIDTRLIRIESNKLDATVAGLVLKVDALESDRDKRAGAVGFVEWISKFGPWLAAFVLAVLAIVGWGDRA